MPVLEIEQFACLSDNYGYLLHDPESGKTACIDTPETAAIEDALARRGWQLDYIWNTHHHYDHAGCNQPMKDKTGCAVFGPAGEADKIPAIDHLIDDGDEISFGAYRVQILNVGGHTLGHIAYYLPDHHIAFVGDALFALGCGRIFEGTPAQMWQSLQKLSALPPETIIYCAHEYTKANAEFALSIDPENRELQERCAAIDVARANHQPTVPTTIALEQATNPFIRPHDTNIRRLLAMEEADDLAVFTEIRRRKDNF